MAHTPFHAPTFHCEMRDLIAVIRKGLSTRTRDGALRIFFQVIRELQVQAEYLGGAPAADIIGAIRAPLALILTKDGREP